MEYSLTISSGHRSLFDQFVRAQHDHVRNLDAERDNQFAATVHSIILFRTPAIFAISAVRSYNKRMIVGDERKRAANLVKHGLDFMDAWRVYDNPLKLTFESPRKGEDRRLDLVTVEDVLLAFIYVERQNAVRAISLRRASRTERRIYEKAIKTQSH